MSTTDPVAAAPSVDLYWIPLGAGDRTHLVKLSGRIYEGVLALRHRRRPRPLFHSALLVHAAGSTYAIEMAPVWGGPDTDHGVTGSGSVGLSRLRRWPLFRYEIRCWQDGRIPDLADAVGGPLRLSADEDRAQRLLDLVPSVPTPTWGRDELHTGEMWNSNSLTSWLLHNSGHDLTAVHPPQGGRAPGWAAGRAARTDPAIYPAVR